MSTFLTEYFESFFFGFNTGRKIQSSHNSQPQRNQGKFPETFQSTPHTPHIGSLSITPPEWVLFARHFCRSLGFAFPRFQIGIFESEICQTRLGLGIGLSGETNLILRSASHPRGLILPNLRAYCSKKHIMSSGLKLIKMAYLPPIYGQNMDFSLLAGSNGYI